MTGAGGSGPPGALRIAKPVGQARKRPVLLLLNGWDAYISAFTLGIIS